MSLRDLNSRHLRLISSYSARYALRGGTGLVFLFLVLATGLFAAHALLSPVDIFKAEARKEGQEMSSAEVVELLEEGAEPAIAWAIGRSTRGLSAEEEKVAESEAKIWAAYLLKTRPSLLSAVLLILLFSVPFLVATGTFNQFSGDVQSRGIRFQLVHTERTNIFLGRFLGTSIFCVIVMAFLIATIALFLGLKARIYPPGELVAWSVAGFLALALLTLPYVAVCSWISSAIDSPFGSLSICALVVGAVPAFAALGQATWQPLIHVKWLLPWGIQNDLLHHEPVRVAGAATACLLYTAVFLFLGQRNFSRRDL